MKAFFACAAILIPASAQALVIWSPKEEKCTLISGVYYQGCQRIDRPGRVILTPKKVTETQDAYLKSMSFTSRLIYNFPCTGSAADETFVAFGKYEFPLVFGKIGGEIVHSVAYNDTTSYKLVRMSNAFTYIGLNCRIEVESNEVLPANLSSLKVHVQAVLKQDAFVKSLIQSATPGGSVQTLQSDLEQAQSVLSFMVQTASDSITRMSLQGTLDTITNTLDYLKTECPIGSTKNCSPELASIQSQLVTESSKVTTERTNLKSFVLGELNRIISIKDTQDLQDTLTDIQAMME